MKYYDVNSVKELVLSTFDKKDEINTSLVYDTIENVYKDIRKHKKILVKINAINVKNNTNIDDTDIRKRLDKLKEMLYELYVILSVSELHKDFFHNK